MNLDHSTLDRSTWRRRHKRISRRIAHDLRTLLPFLGVLFCFVSSATAIVAAERVPL